MCPEGMTEVLPEATALVVEGPLSVEPGPAGPEEVPEVPEVVQPTTRKMTNRFASFRLIGPR
jgi:hypothetical protein